MPGPRPTQARSSTMVSASPPPPYQNVPQDHSSRAHSYQDMESTIGSTTPTQPFSHANHRDYGTLPVPSPSSPGDTDTDSDIAEADSRMLKRVLALAVIAFMCFSTIQFVYAQGEIQEERRVWERERREHAAEVKVWNQERADHEREGQVFQRAREEWQQERKEHAAEVVLWNRERAEHEREGEVFQQAREEWQRERKAHKPFWGTVGLQSPSCLAYNTRRYQAKLRNVPLGADWLQACMSTQVEIQGRTFSAPEKCEIWGDDVYGYWIVDFDQPECQPRWADFTWQKGCLRPGIYGLEAPLWGQKQGDDVYQLCMTTPGYLAGYGDMGHPNYCERRGDRDIGMVGRWEVPDNNCW
ncbi:hypothetical protein BXZ70DRAFT_947824 [Cristinia sonorae]|uniref:Uncharacterized protein n=1 Tax=Cristinia sonorae TaxID=1940300 RepID=A0A8K0UKE4_9AGAR|nr:hypothetical protein BXZ70DRAFT_947824 [Cristinia sonorae]